MDPSVLQLLHDWSFGIFIVVVLLAAAIAKRVGRW